MNASPRRARALLAAAAIAAAAGLVLWSGLIAQAWPRLMLGGTLCGGPALALGHCAQCLPALAVTALAGGLAMLGAMAAGRPRRALARLTRR